ncbi:sigma-E processing peptidase SpoIIGA [Shouchella shacheensis]|uniref:sigma-E processing peptidase SpoIIGA n=1 Tax=Shouchella shacheensis TaxID=1649580 RepID=UPI00073FCC26|nr:sigma-E processing peptidase SpoIIGA [Shouchella shacheensis]
MTVYVDLIWLLNLGIDYLLIAVTALMLKRRFQHIRMMLAALFASLIVVLMFTPVAPLFSNAFIKLGYSAVIVWMAFGYKRFTFFVQGFATFYFVTFVTGGGLFATHYFFETDADILGALPGYGLAGSAVSWSFVLIGFPLVLYFAKHQVETFEEKKINFAQLAKVRMWIEDKEIAVTGLIDSGNQLKDPITKTPVMILETHQLYEAFGKKQMDAVVSLSMEKETEDFPLFSRVRVVPFRAVGQADPFLAALKPDRIQVIHQGETFETGNVLIGLQSQTLSPEEAYQCIVHPKLVQGRAS